MTDSNWIKVKISHEDSKVALCFENLADARKAIRVLKKELQAKSSWKNFALFYLPLFDDFAKIFKINEVNFYVEPDGFSPKDGMALWTDGKNENEFFKVLDVLKKNLNLKFD